ncbi:hypothetical protein NL676_005390 [Syzygium grande]|nr:hypothetical protein NL676_005390 [Syzygium grande]
MTWREVSGDRAVRSPMSPRLARSGARAASPAPASPPPSEPRPPDVGPRCRARLALTDPGEGDVAGTSPAGRQEG